MIPTFQNGDAILTKKTTVNLLKPGDIITYRPNNTLNYKVSHRLISVNYKTGELTTQGDANKSTDLTFLSSKLEGRAIGVAPGLGRFIDAVQKPLFLMVILYPLAACLIVWEIYKLWKIKPSNRYAANSQMY